MSSLSSASRPVPININLGAVSFSIYHDHTIARQASPAKPPPPADVVKCIETPGPSNVTVSSSTTTTTMTTAKRLRRYAAVAQMLGCGM